MNFNQSPLRLVCLLVACLLFAAGTFTGHPRFNLLSAAGFFLTLSFLF